MNNSMVLHSERMEALANRWAWPARFEIMKIPLSFHISVTGVIGYLLAGGPNDTNLIWLFAGIFLLATGSACLNNVQDRFVDAIYTRTRKRAIPSGRITPGTARVQGIFLIMAGSAALLIKAPTVVPLILGLTAVILYSQVYTRLKQKTVYAILPGSMCGMLPPYIGWMFVQGAAISADIFLLIIIMGVWQIPHYWIILMNHRCDFHARTAVPTFLDSFPARHLEHITFVWIVAFACLTLLPILYGSVQNSSSALMLIINAASLTFLSFAVLFLLKKPTGRFLHVYFNFALIVSLSVLVVPRFI